MFTRDFQIKLIVHLAKDVQLFEKARPHVELSDFDLSACQLLWETLVHFYDQFHRLPDINTLQAHIVYMMQNVDGNTLTRMLPEEHPALAFVVEQIAGTTILDSEYYYKQLPIYLKGIRISRAAESFGGIHKGQNVDGFIEQVMHIKDEVQLSDDVQIDSMLGDPEVHMTTTDLARVTTGLPCLNKRIDQGLGRGEIGMIVACPGVGKTTGLINFLEGSVFAGHRGLLLTLELKQGRIKHRYQAITAGIPAQYFKLPVPEWPDDMLMRYNRALNPELNKLIGRASIVDLSESAPTVAQIEMAIAKWKEQCNKQCDADAECAFVAVDWLDKIDPRGISRISRNTKDDRVLTLVSESLGELARKYNVALWTATQANRDGDGREVLQMRHTAYAYHKHDAMDISVGLAPVVVRGQQAVTNSEAKMVCNRKLVGAVMKNRDNPVGSFNLYQGQTLRFWDKKSYDTEEQQHLREGDARALAQFYQRIHNPLNLSHAAQSE